MGPGEQSAELLQRLQRLAGRVAEGCGLELVELKLRGSGRRRSGRDGFHAGNPPPSFVHRGCHVGDLFQDFLDTARRVFGSLRAGIR